MAIALSPSAARNLMVAAQGLDRRPPAPAGKPAVLDCIRRMGVLQIDTIHVVARSPYLVLYSRLGSYDPRWLEELEAEGALFEYWAHEACFIPSEDYPLYRRRMVDPGSLGWRYSQEWLTENPELVERVLSRIRAHGPTRSADFQRQDGPGNGWWDWKPEKRVLEALFGAGELMAARRENFQRLYDLRERVLPAWVDRQIPSLAETHRALALKAVRALGLATERWLGDYFRIRKESLRGLLARLADEGVLLPVAVQGWDEPAYLHPANLPLLEAAPPTLTTLLSPFDPLIWDRRRTRAVFGFDYAIECYLPAAKRRYGYFCLPILQRGELIGRLDAKAHRAAGLFEVKALYLEPAVVPTDELIAGLAQALRECAAWQRTPEVAVRRSEPEELAGRIGQELGG